MQRPASFSRHLGELKALGLVSARAEGVTRWQALRPEMLSEMNRALLEPKLVARRPGSGRPRSSPASLIPTSG
ncbi:MAG: hypothetical protein ABW042_01290 [Phenylobacterium sp.]